MESRGQSAIELITTYGMTLIVLAAVILIITVLSTAPASTVPKSCSIYGTFTCTDIIYGDNTLGGSTLLMKMALTTSGAINVSSFNAVIDGVNSTFGYCSITGLQIGSPTVNGGGSILCLATFPSQLTGAPSYTGIFRVSGNYCSSNTALCPTGSNYVFTGSYTTQGAGNVIIYPDPNYNIRYGANNTNVSVNPDGIAQSNPYKSYVCSLATSGEVSSISWTLDTNTPSTAIGLVPQNTPSCSATFNEPSASVIGEYGINESVTTNPSAIYTASYNGVIPFQTQYQNPEFQYQITNSLNNTVVLAFADSDSYLYYLGSLPLWTGLPTGCQPATTAGFPLTIYGTTPLYIVNDNLADSVYFALCKGQQAGIYPVSFFQNLVTAGYNAPISMAAYVYENPVPRAPNPMFNITSSPAPRVTSLATNAIYVCALGSLGQISSVPWALASNTFYTAVGISSNSVCTATLDQPGSSVIGVLTANIPTTTNNIFKSTSGTLHYIVSNVLSQDTVIIVFTSHQDPPYYIGPGGWAGLPAGCSVANTSTVNLGNNFNQYGIDYSAGSVYDDSGDSVYYAVCIGQPPGIYTVESVLNSENTITANSLSVAYVFQTPLMPAVQTPLTTPTIPSGVEYYIPVNLVNNQNIPTLPKFQQLVSFDAAAICNALVCAPHLNNTEFFFHNGTIINSWYESASGLPNNYGSNSFSASANVSAWVLLPPANFIAQNGSNNYIFIGFEANSVNNFNSAGSTGEAPQLTCPSPYASICGGVYGAYDNGATVFPALYQNFAGTATPSGWTKNDPYNYIIVSNGLAAPPISPNSGNYGIIETNAEYGGNASQTLDSYANGGTPSAASNFTAVGYIAGTNPCGYFVGWALNSYFHDLGGGSYECAGDTQAEASANTYHVLTTYWPSGNGYNGYFGAGADYELLTFGSQYVPQTPTPIGLIAWAPPSYNYVQWMRIRTTPPGTEMPNATVVGSIITG